MDPVSKLRRKDAVLTARIVCGWNCVFFYDAAFPQKQKCKLPGQLF